VICGLSSYRLTCRSIRNTAIVASN
jgi:hypothetical protein